MYIIGSEFSLRRDGYKTSSDTIFSSPLGIQPGIVKHTREKFASDTDCSAIQANGNIFRPDISASENCSLKSKSEINSVNPRHGEQRLNYQEKIFHRPPLPTNGLEKVYSSESSLFDPTKNTYFKWEQYSPNRSETILSNTTQDVKNQSNSFEYNLSSPNSSVVTTKNLFENYLATLTSRNVSGMDNRRLSSISNSPTGSLFDRDCSRNRSSSSSSRDKQNTQPALLTSGMQGFGFPYSIRNTPRESPTTECNPSLEHLKCENKTFATEKPKAPETETKRTMGTFSLGNYSLEKINDTQVKSSFRSYGKTSSIPKESNSPPKCASASFLLNDHTPFSYISSPSVLSRQLSLLKPAHASNTNNIKRSTGNNLTNTNAASGEKSKQNINYSEQIFGASGNVSFDVKYKAEHRHPGRSDQKQIFIPNYATFYKSSSNVTEVNRSGQITSNEKLESKIRNQQNDSTYDRATPSYNSDAMGHSGEHSKPLAFVEYKHPETVKGSALLSTLRSHSMSSAHEVQKKVNKTTLFNNFNTYPGSSFKAKPVFNNHGYLSNSQGYFSGNSAFQPGIQAVEDQYIPSSATEEVSRFNKRTPALIKSHSTQDPQRGPYFTASTLDMTKEAKSLTMKNTLDETKNGSQNECKLNSSVTTENSETSLYTKASMNEEKPPSEEETQLTTKQITGILERKLKFRPYPPGVENRVAKSTTTLTLLPRDHKQVEESSCKTNNNDKDELLRNNLGYQEQKDHNIVQNKQNVSLRPVLASLQNTPAFNRLTQSIMMKEYTAESNQQSSQNCNQTTALNAKPVATVNMEKVVDSELGDTGTQTPKQATTQSQIPPVPLLSGTEYKSTAKEGNIADDKRPTRVLLQTTKTESVPTSHQPFTFFRLKDILTDNNQIQSTDSKQMHSNVLEPASEKEPSQLQNQTIIKRPTFSQIAQKLEEQFKNGASLKRSQSFVFPSTTSAKEEAKDAGLTTSVSDLLNSDERAPAAAPIIRSERRPQSLNALEDESMKPVRMKLFEELTQTLARRSGNLEDTNPMEKTFEQQTYRSILRPKSTEAYSTNKPRISFPPDDKLATTHDYEAEPVASKLDTDGSDGSTSEDERGRSTKGNASSAEETEDSTDSTVVNTPFIRRRRKSFPRPKWVNKEKFSDATGSDPVENGTNRHFPRLTPKEIPTGSSLTPERSTSAPVYPKLTSSDTNLTTPSWKTYSLSGR